MASPRHLGAKTAVLLLVLAGLPLVVFFAPRPAGKITLRPVALESLAGWAGDDMKGALAALGKSCPRLIEGSAQVLADTFLVEARDWRPPCSALATVPAADTGAARRFWESYFWAFELRQNGKAAGFYTGYFVPLVDGALTPAPGYRVPLYRRPPELVDVDLGAFRPALKGERIAGRLEGRRLLPFADRAAIEAGALAGRGLELLWLSDPVDAFFLHIQGSGIVRLPDGTQRTIGYDGQNGHVYQAIGRVLIEAGEIAPAAMSLEAIIAWMRANPERAQALMHANPSFVFFRFLPGDTVVGAQGVGLTQGRSLAVDRTVVPLGAPVWVSTRLPDGGVFRRLMLAQDTGGAIRGAGRGDIFFGEGATARALAGAMKAAGRMVVLVPKTARVVAAPPP
ncbi:MAG: murein transglycosylase A [Pseudomonadota bacterium]